MTEIKIQADHFVPDDGGPPPIRAMPQASKPVKLERFDLQDGLLAVGFISLEIGTWMIYRPAAFILAGSLFFGCAFLIERAKTPHRNLSKKLKRQKEQD